MHWEPRADSLSPMVRPKPGKLVSTRIERNRCSKPLLLTEPYVRLLLLKSSVVSRLAEPSVKQRIWPSAYAVLCCAIGLHTRPAIWGKGATKPSLLWSYLCSDANQSNYGTDSSLIYVVLNHCYDCVERITDSIAGRPSHPDDDIVGERSFTTWSHFLFGPHYPPFHSFSFKLISDLIESIIS